MRKKLIPFFLLAVSSFISQARPSFNTTQVTTIADSEAVEFKTYPANPNGIFKLKVPVTYFVDVKNSYADVQSGSLSYQISSLDGKEVTSHAIHIDLKPKSTQKFTFQMPVQASGFYKLNVMINVSDYDDTIKRVFGVDPESIRSVHQKPADFDDFWNRTRAELAKVDPQYRVTEHPELAKGNTQVYLIEMQSLHDFTVRAWMTIAKDRKPNEKFPVWLLLPGYQGNLVPIYAPRDLVVISVNVRGQGNSKDVINTSRNDYLTTRLDDKDKYVMRGAIMDCMRALDFVFTRPELDKSNIICAGGSMGGYLSLALASLDKRITLCDANNPVFCDWRNLPPENWPLRDVILYANKNHYQVNDLLNNLDYFDLKNFVGNLKCKNILAISLLDPLAPPKNEYAMINSMGKRDRFFVYPELGHEVPTSLFSFLSKWMMDNMGIF